MSVVELSDGIGVDEFPIKFRGYVVIGIDPTGLHADKKLLLGEQIANMGYVGRLHSVQRDITATEAVKIGVGGVEPGWRFRLDFAGLLTSTSRCNAGWGEGSGGGTGLGCLAGDSGGGAGGGAILGRGWPCG